MRTIYKLLICVKDFSLRETILYIVQYVQLRAWNHGNPAGIAEEDNKWLYVPRLSVFKHMERHNWFLN